MKLLNIVWFNLAALLVAVVALDIGLTVLDPIGVVDLRDDLQYNHSHTVAGEVVPYHLEDGVHVYPSGWTATIENGWRVTPDTSAQGCTLAFIGDSFVFGWGVGDAHTYPNLIAQQLPSVEVLNQGVVGYNLEAAMIVADAVDADGYVFLTGWQDSQGLLDLATFDEADFFAYGWSGLMVHTRFFARLRIYSGNPHGYIRYADALDVFVAHQPVLVASPDEIPVEYVPVPYRAELALTDADSHYNADGNAYVADTLLEPVREFVSEVCS